MIVWCCHQTAPHPATAHPSVTIHRALLRLEGFNQGAHVAPCFAELILRVHPLLSYRPFKTCFTGKILASILPGAKGVATEPRHVDNEGAHQHHDGRNTHAGPAILSGEPIAWDSAPTAGERITSVGNGQRRGRAHSAPIDGLGNRAAAPAARPVGAQARRDTATRPKSDRLASADRAAYRSPQLVRRAVWITQQPVRAGVVGEALGAPVPLQETARLECDVTD